MDIFRKIYQYREMIIGMIRRDLKGKYKGSVLGFFWTFLNPLLQLMIYTVVFSLVFRNNIDKFYIYLFIGLVPWIFFSTSLSGGAASVVNQEGLVKKIYFPRQVLPIAYVTSAFVNMLLTFLVIFAVLFVSGFGIDFKYIWALPIIMLVEYLFTLGITLISSALTVYFRDLEYILGIIAMGWMYATPVVYSLDSIPEKYRGILYLNPMTGIVICYRDILYYKRLPEFNTIIMAFIIGVVFLFFGFFIFEKLQKRFVEEL